MSPITKATLDGIQLVAVITLIIAIGVALLVLSERLLSTPIYAVIVIGVLVAFAVGFIASLSRNQETP